MSRGAVVALADLRNRTLALGSRDSGHAAILPVYFLEREGLIEGQQYRTLRFDSDLGKHGDTRTSEVEVRSRDPRRPRRRQARSAARARQGFFDRPILELTEP